MPIEGKPTGVPGELMINLGMDDIPVETEQPEATHRLGEVQPHDEQSMLQEIAAWPRCYSCNLSFPPSLVNGIRERTTGERRYYCPQHWLRDVMRKGGNTLLLNSRQIAPETIQMSDDLIDQGVLEDG